MLSQHQVVEYGPVPFAKKNTILWLPKNVEIYFDFRKHRYYRHYTFDHYMLFDVDVLEKVKLPPDAALSGPASSTRVARTRDCSALRTTARKFVAFGRTVENSPPDAHKILIIVTCTANYAQEKDPR